MKIKRFEAKNMSDALRMIKKEFGEEAVILSAKNVRKAGRLFSPKKSGQVIVTAAVDPAPARSSTQADEGKTSGIVDAALQDASQLQSLEDRKQKILQQYTPITRTGRQKLKPKLVRLMNESSDDMPQEKDGHDSEVIKNKLIDQGIVATTAEDLARKMLPLIEWDKPVDKAYQNALAQVLDAKGLIAPVRQTRGGHSRIVVMTGPAGVGKTAAIAKLAAGAMLHARQHVALISLDSQRIAGTVELERYARLINVSFHKVASVKQLIDALNHSAQANLILVDTPAVTPGDAVRRDYLHRMLAHLETPEIHLLLSATSQDSTMQKIISFFKPLGIERLLFTKLDMAAEFGPLINQMMQFNLPAAYLSTGQQVPEALLLATSRRLAALLFANRDNVKQSFFGEASVTSVGEQSGNGLEIYYVANRNSDIFHHKDCQSVKRIHTDNMLMFREAQEAIAQQFKPCRSCCSDLFIPKPLERPTYNHLIGNK